MIKLNNFIACAIFQNAYLPVKKFNLKFLLRNGWTKDHGLFLGKKSAGSSWEKDYINANSHLYNNVKAGDKSVKLLLYCMKT